ncbi:unnamed protein product [Polarella glacialis]|uniref:EamA domain-containing protein n=1 Tax=Polarella glacialis TaxID=89957 RepID=A0A813HBH4_POLGL|nr:unnamed protein product [Polarella glacialis]
MSISMTLMFLSVLLGSNLGDVSALVSINVVVAALLGRIFLKEALRWVHLVSVAASLLGALLISRPEALFGKSAQESIEGGSLAWLGYVFGPIAGFFDACSLICARKCQNSSEWHVAFAYYGQSCILLILLMFVPLGLPLGQLKSVAAVMAAPWEAIGWLALLTAVDIPNMVLFASGAKILPAAISATTDAATRIVCGYLASVLLFDGRMDELRWAGSGLMLASVLVMAAVREQPEEKPHVEMTEQTTPGCEENGSGAVEIMGDDGNDDAISSIGSVASFAASEFIDLEPSQRRRPFRDRFMEQLPQLRSRKTAARQTDEAKSSSIPSPQPLGATAPMASI